MAGFLEKNKRLIDYSLTEYGRDKLSLGALKYKYYTFSDSSVVYTENLDTQKSFRVSSLDSYLPFEVDSNVTNVLNPEYTLSSVISFDEMDNNILFVSKSTNKTISDYLIDLKYIDDKVLTTENKERDISFDYTFEKDEYDFVRLGSYPTIKIKSESLANIDYVSKDKRFIDKTKNLFLPPVNKDFSSSIITVDAASQNPIENVFKKFKSSYPLPVFTNRNDFMINMINLMQQEKNLHRLEYVLNEEQMIDEDVYLFELHKVNSDQTLNKLSFVDLGSFYDEKEYVYKNIYLIGKIFLTRNIKEEINEENKRYYYEINNDYSFVNMFTMVVE